MRHVIPATGFPTVTKAAIFAALVFLWPSEAVGRNIPESVTLTTDSFAQIMKRSEIESWFAADRHFILSYQDVPEIEVAEQICEGTPYYCEAFIPRFVRSHFILIQDLRLVPETITASVESFAAKALREPVNARLAVREGKVEIAQEAQNGIRVDETKSTELLIKALEKSSQDDLTVTLAGEITPARISRSTVESLGIKELVGTATTNFRGSPKNRIYNIHRAIEEFDGLVIETGQEFSFVDALGPVDGENGYLPELVIKNNRTEPEFGGGICQVSTTVFRAALLSGLKITERRNHAYPVQYYKPYGLDATIYIPKPDLKFRNTTPGAILMIPEIEGSLLTFSFFGTSDGRKVAIDGPHILESNPDGSMKTVFTQTVTDAEGKVSVNDSFYSNYKSPSLFPHPGDEPIHTTKPDGWSSKQWREYKKVHGISG